MADRRKPRRKRAAPVESSASLCHYCGVKLGRRGITARTVDHIVPRAYRGADAEWNKVLACRGCNLSKGEKWPTCSCRKCAKAVKIHFKAFGIRPPGAK